MSAACLPGTGPIGWRADYRHRTIVDRDGESSGAGWGARMAGAAAHVASSGLGGVQRGEVLAVDDPVGVALLGEEALPVRGELLVDRVPRGDCVEPRGAPVGLGTEDPAESLRLLLPRAEGA